MRKFAGILMVLALLAAAPAVLAQQQPGPIAVLYIGEAKAGSEAQFEAAVKEHFAWHRQQGDRWTYHAWQIMSGPRMGTYVIRAGGRNWADFDAAAAFMARDEAHAAEHIGPHTASLSRVFTQDLPAISRWTATSPPPMLAITEFRLKPGSTGEFMTVVGRIHAALVKGNFAHEYAWSATVSGDEGGVYTLVSPRATWAAMAEPSPSFFELLVKEYGEAETRSLLDRFSKIIRSSRSDLVRYRADLSYIP
jgi:hypothetical protein